MRADPMTSGSNLSCRRAFWAASKISPTPVWRLPAESSLKHRPETCISYNQMKR